MGTGNAMLFGGVGPTFCGRVRLRPWQGYFSCSTIYCSAALCREVALEVELFEAKLSMRLPLKSSCPFEITAPRPAPMPGLLFMRGL